LLFDLSFSQKKNFTFLRKASQTFLTILSFIDNNKIIS